MESLQVWREPKKSLRGFIPSLKGKFKISLCPVFLAFQANMYFLEYCLHGYVFSLCCLQKSVSLHLILQSYDNLREIIVN